MGGKRGGIYLDLKSKIQNPINSVHLSFYLCRNISGIQDKTDAHENIDSLKYYNRLPKYAKYNEKKVLKNVFASLSLNFESFGFE